MELRSYVDIAARLTAYAQERYLSLWTDHHNLIERSRAFQTELARRLSQGDVIRELKTALLKAQADMERATDRRIRKLAIAQQQVETLTSHLAASEQNAVGDLQAAAAKASKYKKTFRKDR